MATLAILHMGYSKPKRPILGTNLKVPKSQKKDSRNTVKLFHAANGSMKRLIFEKGQDFEKWPKWPYCMGYSKAKWPIFGTEFKSAKNIAKRTLETH